MRELFNESFAKVTILESGIIKFEWKDQYLSDIEWENFRDKYFSDIFFDKSDKIYIINDCRKQDLMSMNLVDSLVGRSIELVDKKEGRKIFLAFVTGNNIAKIEEFENISNLINNSNIIIQNFESDINALNWLLKNT